MSTYSLTHLDDGVLLRNLAVLVARDRYTTAEMLAHIAEVDARKLYLPAAYPSMFAYCIGELRLSEEAAFKRIHAARTARKFPAIFPAVADGRLHLSAVIMLAAHLTAENAEELLATATHKRKSEIEQLIAQRFPRPDVPVVVRPLPASPHALPLGSESDRMPLGIVETGTPQTSGTVDAAREQASAIATTSLQHAPGRVEAMTRRPKLTPLSPQRFALQLTMSQSTHDKLRYAQELLSHQIPSGDVAEILDRALDALIHRLEKRKFAETGNPRTSQRSAPASRYVPAHVKRAVWKRDGGQCTCVSDAGHRCQARKFLEFDHVDEVARGGTATVASMRLRCRAHNQYEAERTFGTEFMNAKRRHAHSAVAEAQAKAEAQVGERDVVPWQRRL